MKQGILITAYKSFEQLLELLSFFDEDFSIFIHIDKKSQVSEATLNALKATSNVKLVASKYKVNWGSRNHLLSILYLISEGLGESDIEYFHLITGQDYPIRSLDEFKSYFENHKGTEHLEHFSMPAACWHQGGMDRIEYYNFYDALDAKKSLSWILRLKHIQRRLGIKRSISKQLPPFFGGSTYWSLSRAALLEIEKYTNEAPALLKRLKHTFCAEEIYIPTVLVNSDLRPKLVSDNLRFIHWENGAGSPSVLNEEHYDAIKQSNAFFARKFDHPTSIGLLKKLKGQEA